MAIPLGRPSPAVSSNQPGRRPGDGLKVFRAFGRPYSVLLPAGLAMPLALPRERCAFTAPFHPCRARRAAVCFLWRFPWGRPRRTLSGAVSPWSPDFPPRAKRGGHPADWRNLDRRAGRARSSGTTRSNGDAAALRSDNLLDDRDFLPCPGGVEGPRRARKPERLSPLFAATGDRVPWRGLHDSRSPREEEAASSRRSREDWVNRR